ncbi:MAG TPA: condensation domain-containing protein, partial [Thermoanaerobaculia bacterium]|nr:condensation domain-containing protein [Thermoanaerobaculia bacterium]
MSEIERLARAVGLSAEQQELLAALLAEEGIDLAEEPALVPGNGQGKAVPPLTRRPREGEPPLSFAQERLWFLDQLEPGSAQYNIPSVLELAGPLRPAALAWALGEVERRHEAVRTVFTALSDTPAQVLQPGRYRFPLPVIDLSKLAQEQERNSERLTREEAARPFDLTRGPLWRALLLRQSAERHVLIVTMHHIVSDGWSMGVLVREVAELYSAAIEGRPARLAPL